MSLHVIWTQSGREGYVKELLEGSILRSYPGLADEIYVPGRKKLFRCSKGVLEQTDILFPGYLFLETKDINAFRDKFRYLYFNTFIQVLGRDEDSLRTVSDDEKTVIDHLCGNTHLMGVTTAVKEGDKVRFIKGPMVGMEAYVIKLKPSKCYAVVEVPMFGQKRRIAAALETLTPDGKSVLYGRKGDIK